VKARDHAAQTVPGRYILPLLALLMGFASLSTDVYLPAMPSIGRTFDVGIGQVEWSVSGYLAGFAIGQLLWGPIGDRYGRWRPITTGLVLFVIGSAICALAGGILVSSRGA
jgi:MFS transporter, DHA1 family, multidrug resistance protein